MSKWRVTPGRGGSVGGGPVAGSIAEFVIETGDRHKFSAWFAGVGLTAGGPASLTFSDSDTTGYPGDLIVRSGSQPLIQLLKIPADGLLLSIGTAPRNLLPGSDPNAVSGVYGLVAVFGVMNSLTAATSVALDISAEANGWLLAGAYAYSIVGSLAKGVDVGGVTGLMGSWAFS